MNNFAYGKNSREKLDTLHPVLQRIMVKALERSPVDITLIHGLRGEALQNSLVARGDSKTKFPKSKHNYSRDPSLPKSEAYQLSDAVDFAPWVKGRIPWNDTHIFGVICGVIMACAAEEGVKLRWGGDWDMDGSTKDQKFMDFGHIEIDW